MLIKNILIQQEVKKEDQCFLIKTKQIKVLMSQEKVMLKNKSNV